MWEKMLSYIMEMAEVYITEAETLFSDKEKENDDYAVNREVLLKSVSGLLQMLHTIKRSLNLDDKEMALVNKVDEALENLSNGEGIDYEGVKKMCEDIISISFLVML